MTEPKQRPEVSLEVRMLSDLESGEPCIDTLQWLKHEAPTDVFLSTLRLIVEKNGFSCDEETEAWARSQLTNG